MEAPVKPRGNVSDVRIGDFGSAVDAESFDTLFGPLGPNSDQETPDFAPPESFYFRVKNQHPEHHTLSSFDISKYKMYDAWSLGVVYLEVLALGTSGVWDDNGFCDDYWRPANESDFDGTNRCVTRAQRHD